MQETFQSFLQTLMFTSGGLFFAAIILFFVVLGYMIFKLITNKTIAKGDNASAFKLLGVPLSTESEKGFALLKKLNKYAMVIWVIGFVAAVLLVVQAIVFSK
ncbi:MAG: hypothetical protein GKS05_05235 [Nitrospirales bacterium]|nr:hypothetical protein [Nitrospirales bacterium]